MSTDFNIKPVGAPVATPVAPPVSKAADQAVRGTSLAEVAPVFTEGKVVNCGDRRPMRHIDGIHTVLSVKIAPVLDRAGGSRNAGGGSQVCVYR